MSRFMKARVAAVDQLSSSVRRLTLVPADEASPFTPFSPGSHVVLGIPGEGRVCRNAYSLISPPDDPSHYCIAVRRQPVSRGGSEAIHSRVQVGDELELSPPANLFLPHWQARHHLMLAGGIGITPFLSYLPELERRGASWELHLRSQDLDVARFPEAAPYLASGNITQHRLERPNLKALLARQPAGTDRCREGSGTRAALESRAHPPRGLCRPGTGDSLHGRGARQRCGSGGRRPGVDAGSAGAQRCRGDEPVSWRRLRAVSGRHAGGGGGAP